MARRVHARPTRVTVESMVVTRLIAYNIEVFPLRSKGCVCGVLLGRRGSRGGCCTVCGAGGPRAPPHQEETSHHSRSHAHSALTPKGGPGRVGPRGTPTRGTLPMCDLSEKSVANAILLRDINTHHLYRAHAVGLDHAPRASQDTRVKTDTRALPWTRI